jgi:hypothetical protein
VRLPLALVLAFVLPLVQAPSQAPAPAPASSKIWVGRYAEFEHFLKTEPIVRRQDIPLGVTRPVHVFFAPGGLAAGAIVKTIDNAKINQFQIDTYRSEIAAYEMDKLLGLDMVPPTVERDDRGEPVSVQLWTENCRPLKEAQAEPKPDVAAWNRQVDRMRVFDNLIVNIDRNEGNILIDPAWNIILIDHSRTFERDQSKMAYTMIRIDREFFEKLKALDKKTLQRSVGPWILFGVDPILKRRDKIVKHFETLAAQKGEATVIIR